MVMYWYWPEQFAEGQGCAFQTLSSSRPQMRRISGCRCSCRLRLLTSQIPSLLEILLWPDVQRSILS
uniref:Uncharacterized protein n=1 Tax=Physcomitrium patens TaxID=3218 RepID=A0A2K1L1K0_PHYPA|nr:hypothetical protein PHYPA_002683 [Physcomitrium patens]